MWMVLLYKIRSKSCLEGAFPSLLEGFKGKKKKKSLLAFIYMYFFFLSQFTWLLGHYPGLFWCRKEMYLIHKFLSKWQKKFYFAGAGREKKDSLIASGLESLNFTECFRNAGRGTWSPGTYSFVKLVVQLLNRVRFFATPWTVPCQVPLSTGFYRQEYWSGLPLASPKKFY